MADETSRRYLFVAIDRATRWVFIRVFKARTAANARRFLRDLERACPPSRAIAAQCPAGQWMRIRTILTDNGKEFTDRLFGLRKRAVTGAHEFDTLCTMNRPGFTGGQNSRRIARYGTCTKEEDLEAVFTHCLAVHWKCTRR